ncbi:MAG TPA: hypothetical protein VKA98_08265 [Nitrososphaeraceae archaeon]|nr:hypothetical protein [Nitrososphaeraceae archaeon]
MYQTKPGGREGYIDMINPKSDGIFSVYLTITKQSGNSRRIGDSEVRMNVKTLSGSIPWKKIEIAGYAKVISTNPMETNSSLDWYARSGEHNNNIPCERTSLKGIIRVDCTIEWKKERYGIPEDISMSEIKPKLLIQS